MATTVCELLPEPQFGLELLAGTLGVDHVIAWSHTPDLPNLWEWVSPDVPLMTNGLSIPVDPAMQVQLAQLLVGAGAIALAGVRRYMPRSSPLNSSRFAMRCRFP